MTTSCPRCNSPLVAGLSLCRICGFKLKEEASTRKVPNVANIVGQVEASSTLFGPDNKLALYIPSASHTITLIPTYCTVLGRFDPGSSTPPDLDLTPYGAFQRGVSRRHAALYREEEDILTVVDLGSSNHTFLNGEQLIPRESYVLCDGDEVRLGDLILNIYFR